MIFSGSLKEMSLDGVLQLIQLQQSTGKLLLEKPGTLCELYFHNGYLQHLVLHSAYWKSKIKNFVKLYLPTSVVDQFEDTHSLSSLKLLYAENQNPDTPKEVLMRFFWTEIFCSLFTWKKGNYAFYKLPLESNPHLKLSLDGLILEAMKRMDELPQLEEFFPSNTTLQTRLPVIKALEAKGVLGNHLRKPYQHLALLLKESQKIDDLEQQSFLSQYRLLDCLKKMADKEWIDSNIEEVLEWHPTPKQSNAMLQALGFVFGLLFLSLNLKALFQFFHP